MATRWAVANGNWSNTATWDGGTLPGAGDDVYADGKTVAIDQDINVASIRTQQRSGGTVGGEFQISSTRTLTCDVISGGGSTCLKLLSGSYTVTLTGNATNQGTSSSQAIWVNGGTLLLTGNVTAGNNDSCRGIFQDAGVLSIVGTVSASTGNNAFGIRVFGGTASITGSLLGSAAPGGDCISGATLTITGNVTGGSNVGVLNNGTCNIYSTGTSEIKPSSSTNAYAVRNDSGTTTIGTSSTPHKIYGGRNQPSVYANGGQIIIYANLAWDAANSNTAALGTSNTGIIRLQGNIQHHYGTSGLYGMSLVTGRVLMSNADNTYTYYAQDNGSGAATGNPAIHYGASLHTGSMPAAADVRYPVTYGPDGAYTGTCRVPAAASVAYGVPVDNTTGTAVLTPSAVANAVWDEALSGHSTAGTAGKALSDAAAGGGSGGGGDPGAIATAVWSHATRTLTAFDFSVTVDTNNDKTGYTLTPAYDRAKDALAVGEYQAPNNASIAAIKAQTDKLTFDASNNVHAAMMTPTTGDIADAVWDEPIAEHTTSGSTGAVLAAAGSGSVDYGTMASAVWSHATRTLTAFGFSVTVGVNNDKTGYTLTPAYDRAKTALAYTEYTAPDNAGVAAIKAKTDHLTFDASDRVIANAAVNQDKTGYALTAAYDRAKNALAFSEYVAPDNASITAIKGQTDKLTFDPSNRVVANVAVNQDKTGYSLTTAYDRAKDALKVTEYVAPDNTTIGTISTKADAIKAKTDKLTFNTSNQVEAVVSDIDIDEGALGAAVWDAMRGDHQLPGTTGEAISVVMAMAGGSGARTISVTVTDGTNPLEGAKVRLQKGSESYIRATDASGQTTFALDDGTWSWRVTLPGYVGQAGTLVVDGDETLSVTLVAVTITPSDPGFVTGYAYCYDQAGQPEAGVQVHVQMLRAAPSAGLIADGTIRTLASDASGLVQVTNMIRGAMYQISRGTARGETIVVPVDAPDVFALPSLVGRP